MDPRASQAADNAPRPSDAITGLRLFAALAVANAHGLSLLAGYTKNGVNPFEGQTLVSLVAIKPAYIGMASFFVLSGFVIHYNYFYRLRTLDGRQLHNFYVARMARLFPLYFALVGLEMLWGKAASLVISGRSGNISEGYDLAALPYHLTLSQSWIWNYFNGLPLIFQYHLISQVSWSISTEWFFYLSFPILAIGFRWLKTFKITLIVGGLYLAIAFMLLTIADADVTDLDAYATQVFGPTAAIAHNEPFSFVFWAFYFWPGSRLLDFICGCFAAHLYILDTSRGRPFLSPAVAAALSWVAVAIIVTTHVILFFPDNRPHPIPWHLQALTFGYAPGCMLLIYLVATYESPIQRILASRLCVLGGTISYSIYLIHMSIFDYWRYPAAPYGSLKYGLLLIRYLAAFAIVLAVSYTLYNYLEAPCRRMFRRLLEVSAREQRRGDRLRRGLVLGILTAPLIVILAGQIVPVPGPNRISNVSARYGGNCGVDSFIDSESVSRACVNHTSCAYPVSPASSDPSVCSRDFVVQWRCTAEHGRVHALEIKGEAGGSVAELACARD